MNQPVPNVATISADLGGDLAFLSAPGNLGSLIAAHDWAATPLGPIAGWPQSLRTAVSLILNSPHPLWIGWGPQMTYLYNDAYIEVLSLSKHPWALGRPASEVWAEIWEFVGPIAERVMRQAEGTFVDDVRLFMRRGDILEETYYSFSYSPILDESGAVGGLFCPSNDATSKNLNARRMRTLSELSSSALTERSVVAAYATVAATLARNPDDIPFALLYAGDGELLTLQQALHLPADSPLAPPVVTPDMQLPWPLQAVRAEAVTRSVKVHGLAGLPSGLAGQPVREAVLLPLLASGQDEPLGVILMGVNSARKLDEEYRTFYELVTDQAATAISNARAAEDQHRHTEMLAELDRAKTAFFSNVSHEFRTPLTLMLGPLDDALADADAPLPAPQLERLQLMRRNALRLQKLVNTLLDFSRVQAGRMEAGFVPVDLAALTADLASSFRSVVESAGLSLTVDCALPQEVYVDPAMWEKIVLNLISNAFKFTFSGGIAVTLAGRDGHAVLEVADTGIGIAAADQSRVFERFQRIEGARSRTHEGSGIGLALVRDLVAMHGGGIVVASEPGHGSRFTVALPLGRAHLRDEQMASQPPTLRGGLAASFVDEAARWLPGGEEAANAMPAEVEAGNASTQGARVLLADDNADMRDYLQRLLAPRWRVEIVADGRQALAAARRELPDLIVSDVMMPELDGFGMIAALRADPVLGEVPVMLLSARAGEEARIEGIKAGADDYLVKPFSARELLARIDTQLVRAQLRRVERLHAQRLAEIFHQAPVGIAILRGPTHIYEMANGGYGELIAHRPVEGKPIREALPELAGQGIFELLDQVYASGVPYLGHALQVSLNRGPDGSSEECFFDFVYQPMHDARGAIDGIAVVAFEVTELVQARRTAEVANRAKDEFLAMLGHELRNPLSPILIALELMRLRGVSGADKERAIIERQARHLVRLVDDLLDVARIAQGKIELKRERIEAAMVTARAIETVSPLLEERQHALRVDVPSAGLMLEVDPVRMGQVISNLLTNAAKYTDKGGHITVRAFRDGADAVIEVADSGIGMEADMLPRIFDKFVQETQAIDRAGGGLGLGLAIVKSLVGLHGGTVAASSPGPGQGSTFSVRVPLTAQAAGSNQRNAALATRPRHGLTVMLVDDLDDVRESLAAVIEIDGHEVAAAADAASALRLARSFVPDIAILDIGLPGMDGYELALELRKLPGWQDIQLIALTGYGHESDRQRSVAAGFSAHLVKPVEFPQLMEILAAAKARKTG